MTRGERQDAADIAQCYRQRHLPLGLAHRGADRGAGRAGVGLHQARERMFDGRVGAFARDPQQRLRFAQGEVGQVAAIAADRPQHRQWRPPRGGGHCLEPLQKPIGRGGVGRRRPAIGPVVGDVGIGHAGRGWA